MARAEVGHESPSSARFAASLSETLVHAQNNVLQMRKEGSHWNLPSYLGTHYVSQYYLVLRLMGRDKASLTRFDTEHFRKLLLETQLPDGSWHAVKDANVASGDLNATIFNYWALRAMGVPASSEPLKKAAIAARELGGLESASLFSKVFLALFGVIDWEAVPEVPYWIFNSKSPLNHRDFGQWVGPHLLPIAYLRKMRVSHPFYGSDMLDELRIAPAEKSPVKGSRRPGRAEKRLISKLLKLQQPRGSMGGYTGATLFSILVLEHYQSHKSPSPALAFATEKGFEFIDSLLLDSEGSAYLGAVSDGRYWDTSLLGIALLESGIEPEDLRSTADYLALNAQTPSGGFAFGEDFWHAPDADDTAEALLFLSRFQDDPGLRHSARAGVRWLLKMQNSDGGWGAFAKNNYGNALLESITRGFLDSADLFDESSADLTGHVLEALSAYGLTLSNSKAVRKAVKYLKKHQSRKTGSWEGRWGINHIYGTSTAVVGLIAAGMSADDPTIQRAIAWLSTRQNSDGGYGESTRSYTDRSFWGKGISTPTQSAWALQALVAVGLANSASAHGAAAYLIDEFWRHGLWTDPSTVGTGHPRVVYMDYPSYAYAFPLIALSRLEARLEGRLDGRFDGRFEQEVGQFLTRSIFR